MMLLHFDQLTSNCENPIHKVNDHLCDNGSEKPTK
jgi:hypothetical protein